jgi:4-carboxymuconolactone decarboxylase
MARVPVIEGKTDVPAAHHDVVDAITRSRGRISGPFSILLHSPDLAGRAAHLGAYVRFESALTPVQRELAILATARALDCAYEWAYHAPEARKAGVTAETVAAIRERRGPSALDTEAAEIVEYARQVLTAHHVDENTFAALRARLGVQGIVELTATVGYYAMLACTLNAFEVTPEPGTETLWNS